MKIRLIISILWVSTAFLTAGCGASRSDFGFMRPAQLVMEPPAGSPEYQQGWIDGCESGYSGYGNHTNKLFYSWRQDPILTNNPVYYQSWRDAYSYCATYGMMTDEHGLGNRR
jgi:hypothetical protein